MSLATYQLYFNFVKSLKVGKHLPDAVYLHKSILSRIDAEALSALIRDMEMRFDISDANWNLVKLAKRSFKITLLHYPRFEQYAYPELQYSYTIDLQEFTVRKASYATSDNPPILHRKETFIHPEHPLYLTFKAITQEGEAASLYENSKAIGFKQNWERLIDSKAYYLDALGRLHHKDTLQHISAEHCHTKVERHRTAIDRNKLSAPMQILGRHGYFDGNYSVLDYGYGKGDDIRELAAHGIDVKGWDPVHKPNGLLAPSDIVNLGFVLNVIEDVVERKNTLLKAFEYARQILIVSVMVAGESLIRKFTPYKDGIITSRNTFQRYYSQTEFKSYLENAICESAIAVGQGIFLLFKDKNEEQHFLFERQQTHRRWRQLTQREARTQTKQITRELIDNNKGLFVDFWEASLQLGRIPSHSEFEFSERLRTISGSHKKAFDALKDYFGEELFIEAQQARCDNLLVYLALGQFARRKPYSTMPDDLKRDIQTFFGSYSNALALSTKLLFSVGNPATIAETARQAFNKIQIGEFNDNHSWIIPKDLLNELPPALRIYVGCASQLYGDLNDIDLIKIYFTSGKVSLMKYDDFTKEQPLLIQRIKIKLRELDIDFFEYGGEEPPLKLITASVLTQKSGISRHNAHQSQR